MPADTVDYRALLKTYIRWVLDNEGVDYITHGWGHGGTIRTNYFDDAEWSELHEIAAEVASATIDPPRTQSSGGAG